MKCIIVDDEEMSRQHLAHLCSKIEGLDVLASFEDPVKAIQYIKENPAELLFLDIEMPELTGIELVKTIPNLPPVIFTTSKTEFALEAFEYDVIDYLVKPIQLVRFMKAVEKAKALISQHSSKDQSKEFYVRSEGKFIKILFEDIRYIETLDDYLSIYLDDGSKHIIHSTLSAMDDKLNATSNSFLKVHRSFIVNLHKVNTIEDTHLAIHDKVIPVSRQQRKALMERVNLL